jgi:Rne/Rng family ribonuclease
MPVFVWGATLLISEILIGQTSMAFWGAAMGPGGCVDFAVTSRHEGDNPDDIFWGTVTRVMPDLDCVFVDIGLPKKGFLPLRETRHQAMFDQNLKEHRLPSSTPVKLQVGQKLLVQVVRSAEDEKGPKLSRRLQFLSPYQVYLPGGQGLSGSSRLLSKTNMSRFTRDLAGVDLKGGVVLRSAALDVSPAFLRADLRRLHQSWQCVVDQLSQQKFGLVQGYGPTPAMWLETWVPASGSQIKVDSPEVQRIAAEWLESKSAVSSKVVMVDSAKRMNHWAECDRQIAACLNPRVDLPSGGNLVIAETEAMVTVDVNTASFKQEFGLGQIRVLTNLEAAKMIPLALRRRCLAGIVVIDFVRLEDPCRKQEVREALINAFKEQGLAARVSEYSAFGLIEVLLPKSSPSLRKQLEMLGLVNWPRTTLSGVPAMPAVSEGFRSWLAGWVSAAKQKRSEIRVRASATAIAQLLLEDEVSAEGYFADGSIVFEVAVSENPKVDVFLDKTLLRFPEEPPA